MASLIEACALHGEGVKVAVVVSPVAESPAIDKAREASVAIEVVDPKSDGYSDRLLEIFRGYGVSWVCLAGLTSKLPTPVIHAFDGRILNIHPSLLPRFGGKGMYGRHVHEAVIASGERESGCTVHVVTENYDEGPIVLQKTCPVLPTDTGESLAERILGIELKAFPEALFMAIGESRIER